MSRVETAFFDALCVGVRGGELPREYDLTADEWEDLLLLSSEQEVLPLVYDAVCSCSSFHRIDRERRKYLRDKALSVAIRQIVQTNEFLNLILHAHEKGLDPVVLKGITIRSLYPKPMLRPSVDEDLLVPSGEMRKYHDFLVSEGLEPDDKELPPDGAPELSYHRPNSPTYIELHSTAFPSSPAYGDCNEPFVGAAERSTEVTIEDVTMRTLSHTDHLLYLILHAYKHFLHGGFGIRHVCDMGMFAEHWGARIDAGYVMAQCEKLHIGRFAAALFRICEEQLGFGDLGLFPGIEVDTAHLLDDIISGGLYGANDINRMHSSTLTLEAVASQREGRKRRSALHSVFLPRKDLDGRYPYLRKRPWLLPAAWAQRIWKYVFDRRGGRVSASESLKIGRDRIELLKEYDIIE